MGVFLLLFPISVVLSLGQFQSCPDDQCRILAFPSTLFFVGERLINHSIANISVIDRDTCEYRCYLDYNCVSVNFYFGENGAEAHNCELNNSTAKEYDEDLVQTANYVYHGTKNFCAQSPCKNHGTCQSGFTTKRYRCLCASGFTGHDCEKDINECVMNTDSCSDKNATCENTKGSFKCICNPGFSGDMDNCTDIDECVTNTHNCSKNTNCTNTEGSYNCSCNPGFSGDMDNCTDIDECVKKTHNCSKNADCINTEGSYNCSCNPGYEGDGHKCRDIDECSQNSHNCSNITATCNNTKGSFKCICKPGFSGDGYSCTDIDECAENIHNCSKSNATCTNSKGSFNCSCNTGLRGDGYNCSDIDECAENIHNCSKSNATCTNSKGSFNCSCNPGFKGDGYNCTDINECVQNHICSENANCTNTEGSYNCSCNPGFSGDGHGCEDINECVQNHGCSENANCTNTEGSYNCSCIPGFSGDGHKCEDIEECVQGTHDCSEGKAICLNTEGSFNCSCKPGFTGDGHSCKVYKDCAEAYKKGQHINGIYTIDPDGEGSFDVFCNQTRGQGGWTVFLRKQSDSINFNRNWTDYKNGFGNLSENFWLGLDKVHRLTKSDKYKLIVYWKKESNSFHFDQFQVESEEACYKVIVEGSGSDWGPLKSSNGQSFATRDQVSNGHTGHMCVEKCGIGWWYNSTLCHCPLGHGTSAAKSRMMIRPSNFSPTP